MQLLIVEEGLIIRPETVEDGVQVGSLMGKLPGGVEKPWTASTDLILHLRVIDEMQADLAAIDRLLGGPKDSSERLRALKRVTRDADTYRNPGRDGL